MTDIKKKYIRKCTILSRLGIFHKGILLKLSEPERLRTRIINAVMNDRIFFFIINNL